MKPPCIYENLAVPGLVACDCLTSLELIHFHICVSFLFTSDPVSVTRGIFWPWLFIGSPLPLNMVFFNPRGWWNPFTLWNCACPRPLPLWNALLCRSWAICTNACGIELWKKLSCTLPINWRSAEEYFNLDCWFAQMSVGLSFKRRFPYILIQCWSLKEYFSLDCSSGPLLLIWYFFIPEVGETLLAFTILDVPGPLPVDILALLELSNLHKCVRYRASKEAFSYNSDPVLVTKGIFWASLSVHWVSPLCLWKFCFPRPRPCHVWIALLHWSWWI